MKANNIYIDLKFKALNRTGVEVIAILLIVMTVAGLLLVGLVSLEWIPPQRNPRGLFALILISIWVLYIGGNIKKVRIVVRSDDTIQIYRGSKLIINEPVRNLLRITVHGSNSLTYVFQDKKATFTNLMLSKQTREKQDDIYCELYYFFCRKYHFRGAKRIVWHALQVTDYVNPSF